MRDALKSKGLLGPADSVVQALDKLDLMNAQRRDEWLVTNNTIGLAKAAKAFGVPTILTTVVQERGGFLPKDR